MKDKIIKQNLSGNNYGFIPLPRTFLEHSFWSESRKYSKAEAFLDLLFMARYGKEPEAIFNLGEKIIIEHGMIISSILKLSGKWNRSNTWIKKLLNVLQEEGLIKLDIKRNRRVMIKILYQSPFFSSLIRQNNYKNVTENTTETLRKHNRNTHKNKEIPVNKEKEITSLRNDGFAHGNSDISHLIDYFKEKLGLPLLDESVKTNRRYCWLALKKFGGLEKMKLLIDVTAQNQFWKTKVTSFKQLYYKGVQIISSTKGGEKYGQYKTD